MAKQVVPPHTSTIIETVQYDQHGNQIGVMTYVSEELPGPNNSMIKRTRAANILTADGAFWNPGQKDELLGLCRVCGHNVRLKQAKYCVDCGRLCCPEDRKRVGKKRWCCRPCARQHALAVFVRKSIRSLFFVEEE